MYSEKRTCMTNFTFWYDNQVMSCDNYAASNWCTINGQYGINWSENWGRIEFATYGDYSAWNCPQCGCIGVLYEYFIFRTK